MISSRGERDYTPGNLDSLENAGWIFADLIPRVGLGRVPGYPRFVSGGPVTRVQIYYPLPEC